MIAGNRKFYITVGYLLTSVVLVCINKIPSTDWMQFTSWVVLAYFGGNVGEHFIKTKT